METVTLETGTENVEHPDDYECGKEVQVPVWDFQELLVHYLLDPTLFGNKDNLVNPDDPFSKFVIADLKQSKEYLASRHYSDTYDITPIHMTCLLTTQQQTFLYPSKSTLTKPERHLE
jgi:hypothetical protein